MRLRRKESRKPAHERGQGQPRLLVPFTAGTLDPAVLDAAIRIARVEHAVLVPAYLLVVPLEFAPHAPLQGQVGVAMPLLEAVELAAARAGVPVDARIERGRTAMHALQKLWDVERFDRIIVPAPIPGRLGFSPRELTWILTHAPNESETLILRPSPDACAA
jgi:nucleotide-binding universal stress UspA family protein